MYEEIDYANVLDKIDWKLDIRLALGHAHRNDRDQGAGLIYFMDAVSQAVDIIGIEYPGWDAREDVDNFIKKTKKKYNYIKALWYKYNTTAKRERVYYFERNLKYKFHKEILHFLDDYVGKRRMLLFGKPDSKGLEYDEL